MEGSGQVIMFTSLRVCHGSETCLNPRDSYHLSAPDRRDQLTVTIFESPLRDAREGVEIFDADRWMMLFEIHLHGTVKVG